MAFTPFSMFLRVFRRASSAISFSNAINGVPCLSGMASSVPDAGIRGPAIFPAAITSSNATLS